LANFGLTGSIWLYRAGDKTLQPSREPNNQKQEQSKQEQSNNSAHLYQQRHQRVVEPIQLEAIRSNRPLLHLLHLRDTN
jgi:hypothetical protein